VSKLPSLSLVVLTLAACAGNAGNAPPPGSASEPLSTWDVVEADTGSRMIYARNNTSQPITIESITITRCENLRQNCGDHPAHLVVPPGKSLPVFHVDRLSSRLAWSWGYRIHTAPRPVTMSTGPTRTVVTGPTGAQTTAQPIAVDSFRAAVPPITTDASCGHITVPDLPEGHRALLMVFGTPSQPAARRIIVRYDANGNAYDYNETRTGPPEDGTATWITIDLVRQRGLVRNARAGGTSEWYTVTGGTLTTAQSLDRPAEMIARIKRECSNS
jgi:hypothetical protein